MYHISAVSNRYAVNPYSAIRTNTKAGAVKFIELEPADWTFSETDDLVVVDVTDYLDSAIITTMHWSDDISWLDECSFLDRNFISASNVGIGDHTIMMGLFVDHDGGERNVSVGRFGNLAAMPDVSTPVRLSERDAFARPAYLSDMRSRSGFSGSPVWVWRTPYDDMNFYMPDGFWIERKWVVSQYQKKTAAIRGVAACAEHASHRRKAIRPRQRHQPC